MKKLFSKVLISLAILLLVGGVLSSQMIVLCHTPNPSQHLAVPSSGDRVVQTDPRTVVSGWLEFPPPGHEQR